MKEHNKYNFNKTISFGNRKICNVGLSILRCSFSHALARSLQNVSVIEENPRELKSHKSRKERGENERPESVDAIELAPAPLSLESSAIYGSRALAMQPFLPLLQQMQHQKNPLSQGTPLSKQHAERQALLGSEENKERGIDRNLGLLERPKVELAIKLPGQVVEKETVSLLRNRDVEQPRETPPTTLRQENPLPKVVLSIEVEEKMGIAPRPSPVEHGENGPIRVNVESEKGIGPFKTERLVETAPLSQQEILEIKGMQENGVVDRVSSPIEKGGEADFVGALPNALKAPQQRAAQIEGVRVEHSPTSIQRTNPSLIKGELPQHLESSIARDRGQSVKQLYTPNMRENQVEKPTQGTSIHMQSERVVEKQLIMNPSLRPSEQHLVPPRQGGETSLPLPKEAAVLTRTQTFSDAQAAFKPHHAAHEIGNDLPRNETHAYDAPLNGSKETDFLTPHMADLPTSNLIEPSSPSLHEVHFEAIGKAFAPGASHMGAILANVDLPQGKTFPVSRIIALSKTIAEPVIARFGDLPGLPSREPAASIGELAAASEQPVLSEHLEQPEQQPEFTVRIYSQPIIIDNYTGVGRL